MFNLLLLIIQITHRGHFHVTAVNPWGKDEDQMNIEPPYLLRNCC